MESGTIPGIDRPVSRLVMGSVAFPTMPPEAVHSLLDSFVEQGGTAVESAHDYGGGAAQRIIGDWLRSTGVREQLVVVTKGAQQARGFFSGRFSPEEPADPEIVRVYYREDNWECLRRARETAARHGCSPTQVALAWVLGQPLEIFALIGPRTLAETRTALPALDVALTPDELRWLNLER